MELFHRTVTMQNQPDSPVKIEVIQAGINPERKKDGFPAIALERTSVTGLKHVDGTVSMARGGPDSATSDFFICIGDQPELDFGGSGMRMGRGLLRLGGGEGMDVVRKIQGRRRRGRNWCLRWGFWGRIWWVGSDAVSGMSYDRCEEQATAKAKQVLRLRCSQSARTTSLRMTPSIGGARRKQATAKAKCGGSLPSDKLEGQNDKFCCGCVGPSGGGGRLVARDEG